MILGLVGDRDGPSVGGIGQAAVEPWEIPGLGRMAVSTGPEGNRVGLVSR